MKMVINFANETGDLTRSHLIHSIRRNFGGFDPDGFNPMEIFEDRCPRIRDLPYSEDNNPPIDSMGLIKSSLFGVQSASSDAKATG